jgi:hypothetical protein
MNWLPPRQMKQHQRATENLDGIGNELVTQFLMITCVRILLHSMIINLNECFEFPRQPVMQEL